MSFHSGSANVIRLLVIALPFSTAHMHLSRPTPLNMGEGLSHLSPVEYNFHVGRLGAQTSGGFPCLGQLVNFGAAPVAAQWTAGQDQIFYLDGPSPHYGGSCQVSISIDGGKTWRVMKSWLGACPSRLDSGEQKFIFNLAKQVPSGTHIFSWSWFNREREMYHNCAKVEITNPEESQATTLEEYPHMLVANIDHNCLTPLNNAETLFPDEGTPDRVEQGDSEYNLELPSGPGCVKRISNGTPSVHAPNLVGNPVEQLEPVENLPVIDQLYCANKESYDDCESVPADESEHPRGRSGCRRNE